MNALIWKDLYAIKGQLKYAAYLLLFFMALSFFFDMGPVVVMFTVFFGSLQVMTSFTFDEMSKWDKYALTLPISRRAIIASKYLLSLLLTVGSAVIVTPLILLFNVFFKSFTVSELFSMLCMTSAGALLMLSLLIPIFLKFGTQKGRFVLFAVVFFPVFFASFFSQSLMRFSVYLPSTETLQLLGYTAPLFMLIPLAVSYSISVIIYSNKEF
ncbi:MAG: ABC-2 transporter permease [Lysinibacillus sp.]